MPERIQQNSRADAGGNRQQELTMRNASDPRPVEDERYPGSFFRVPGVPKPGKTTWSLAK